MSAVGPKRRSKNNECLETKFSHFIIGQNSSKFDIRYQFLAFLSSFVNLIFILGGLTSTFSHSLQHHFGIEFISTLLFYSTTEKIK